MSDTQEKLHRHHVLFSKKAHNILEPTKKLRSHPSLIVPIRNEEHVQLHSSISQVPILSMHAAQKVLELYEPDRESHILSIENLIDSYATVSKIETLSPIEKQIASIAVNALYSQLPFIIKGIGHIE